MRYNPLVKKKLDSIKDDQLKKNCYAVLYALSVGADSKIFYSCKTELSTLNSMGFINSTSNPITTSLPLFLELSSKDSDLFEETDIQKIIDARIDEYRNLFKGKKVGSMGDKDACKNKLLRWMSTNAGIKFDDILAATEYYITHTNPNYLMQADYFIYKIQGLKNEEISKLSSILDEVDLKTISINPFQDNI